MCNRAQPNPEPASIGTVASAMRLAEMPELGAVSGEQAAALSLLEPIANDSGSLRGKRAIASGRRALRHVLSQAALVGAHHYQTMKVLA
ncbi:transposase [uncultured Mameliella sp.]|uniref:transposase n=1 Tax=uncultured Mameliella sp. TaxID=1447087 RepID=UPI00345D6090